MSNILQFDPSEGFVALPVAILEIEMSPGAFRTLTELCRMANLEGYCWPSFQQLSEKLGRSKAAISGYVKELKATGLLDTINQRMANGYNYRLKFLVTFWADWRSALSKNTPKRMVRETECSVQSDERRVNSKNHNNKKHTPTPHEGDGEVEDICKEWNDCARNAAYPGFSKAVSDQLIDRSKRALVAAQSSEEPVVISADIQAFLHRSFRSLGVTIDRLGLEELCGVLDSHRPSASFLKALEQELPQLWKPHWKNLPSTLQFRSIISAVKQKYPTRSQLGLIKSFLKRWAFSRKHLPKDVLSSN